MALQNSSLLLDAVGLSRSARFPGTIRNCATAFLPPSLRSKSRAQFRYPDKGYHPKVLTCVNKNSFD
jgi:hypothetical protein